MVDILLTIISFNILIIFFKFFTKFGIDNLQALTVNYFVAGFCGLYFSNEDFSIQYIINSPWIIHAIAIGILFISTFNLYAIGTQKVGIAVTTISNKLSLFIPVGVALILYPNEQLSWTKIIGFILAVIGIYLSATKNKKLSFEKKYLWLIIIVFVGQGLADTIFNNAQVTVVDERDSGLFFMVMLFSAGIIGVFVVLGRTISKKTKPAFKNVLAGLIFGAPNFASLIFFFKALETSGLESSQVFPIVSMGVVILSAIVGLVIFREKLTLTNWIGLGFAVVSIYVITFF